MKSLSLAAPRRFAGSVPRAVDAAAAHTLASPQTLNEPANDPRVVVAGTGNGAPLPLGLDRPMRLLGGVHIQDGSLCRTFGFEWLPQVVAIVGEACAEAQRTSEPWLRLPPFAFVSKIEGIARHVATAIAVEAGLPHFHYHVGAGAASTEVDDPSVHPILAVALSGCANPLIRVTGLEDADGNEQDAFARLLSGGVQDAAFEAMIGMPVDLSQVSWMICVREAPALSATIGDRIRIVDAALPLSEADRELLCLGVLQQVLRSASVRGFFEALPYPTIRAALMETLARTGSVIHVATAAKRLMRDASVALASHSQREAQGRWLLHKENDDER